LHLRFGHWLLEPDTDLVWSVEEGWVTS
jgi:hypothetical protein